MPGQAVPFRWITGLPPEAQREIERDFLALQEQITATPSVFDAIIDPVQTTADPANHIYPNLTTLVAHETWSATRALSVGVHQRADIAIIEPAGVNLAGHGPLFLFGLGNSSALTHGWDIKTGFSFTLAQIVYMENLWLDPSVGGSPCDQGNATFFNCRFGANITAPSGRNCVCYQCQFGAVLVLTSGGGVGVTYTFFDCQGIGLTQTTSLVGVLWYGGTMNGAVSTTNNFTMWAAISGNVSCANGSVNPTTRVDIIQLGSNAGGLTMAAGVTGRVEGAFASLTWAGTAVKTIRGSFDNGGGVGCDITGPAKVTTYQAGNSFGDHLILRGDAIECTVTTVSRIECIGLTNSQTKCVWTTGNGGNFTLDAASHNNIIVASGFNNGTFGGYTDSGTKNRLITELTDTLLTSGNPLSPSILNGEIAAVQSGIRTYGGPTGPDWNQVFLLMGG